MFFAIGTNIAGRGRNGRLDLFEDRFDAGWSASQPGLSQALQFLRSCPFCFAVEGKRHTVIGKIDGCGYKVIDGSESSFAQNIVIDNSEVLQVRIAIAKRAVDER